MTQKTQGNKPVADEQGRYRFAEVIQFLESRYGFNASDFSDAGSHFERWANARGYGENVRDPEGKQFRSSQIWFDEYCHDPNGLQAEPRKENFKRWLDWMAHAHVRPDVLVDPYTLNIQGLLEKNDQLYAPLAQPLIERMRERVTARINEMAPPEYRARLVRDALSDMPESAFIPAFARTIMGHLQTEFGDRIMFVFGHA